MGSGRSRRRPLARGMIAKGALAGLFVLVAGWLVVAVGVANGMRDRLPGLARAVAPFDARTKAELASQMLLDARAPGAEASALAESALLRDPTVIPAWRTLALSRMGDPARTVRLFRLMDRMSHRDIATQLWLIEENVRRNDVPGALRHYDYALRTTPAAADALLPILADATASDAIVAPLAAMLRTDPPWRQSYFFVLAQRASAGGPVLRLFHALGTRRLLPRDDIIATLIDRVALLGDFGSARDLYRLARPAVPWSNLRNGGFAGAASFSTFEWSPSNAPGISADQITLPDAGDGSVLEIRAEGGSGGIATQQTLILGPGRYQLTQQSGLLPDVPRAELSWRIVCLNRERTVIAEIPIPASGQNAASAPAWQVPAANCPAQWLAIVVRGATESAAAGGWLDSVAIRRLPG